MATSEAQRQPVPAPHPRGIFSQRLIALLDDVLQGKAPNAGRFCGYCYHPQPTTVQSVPCPHCGRPPADWPAVRRVPDEVFAMFSSQRAREAWIVRGIAWGGLTTGVVLGLVPLALVGVTWWTVLAFFGAMAFFYLGSANLANTVGDAVGYRWGQSVLERRWRAFVQSREQSR